MNVETNPYATPASAEAMAIPDPSIMAFREGRLLVVRDGAILPEVCIVTNQPTTAGDWRKRVLLTWTPSWVIITILVNVLVLLILALVLRKKAWVTYSLTRITRARIVRKQLAGWLLILVSLLLFGSVFTSKGSTDLVLAAVFGAIVLLLVAVIIISRASPLRAVKHRNGWLLVKGCSTEFLDTLPPCPPGI